VVPQLRDLLPRIATEFERARRYERTVTVAVFLAAGEGDGLSTGQAGTAPAAHSLGHILSGAIRAIDLVARHPLGFCVVVMPEIGSEEGRRAVSRMRALCASRLGLPIDAGIAGFPHDAWLFLDLVDMACRHARSGERGGSPRGYSASPEPSSAPARA
jgi:hypothetical protein